MAAQLSILFKQVIVTACCIVNAASALLCLMRSMAGPSACLQSWRYLFPRVCYICALEAQLIVQHLHATL